MPEVELEDGMQNSISFENLGVKYLKVQSEKENKIPVPMSAICRQESEIKIQRPSSCSFCKTACNDPFQRLSALYLIQLCERKTLVQIFVHVEKDVKKDVC